MQNVTRARKKNRLLLNESGSILLIVTALIISISALVEVVSNQISLSKSVFMRIRLSTVRDSLANNIGHTSSMGSTFRTSVAQANGNGNGNNGNGNGNNDINGPLRDCVLGTGTCNAGIEYPVDLFTLAADGSVNLLSGRGPYTAGNAKPAYYDMQGNPCAGGNGNNANKGCPFQVYSTFIANCAGGAPSCQTAQSISIHYSITTSLNLGSLNPTATTGNNSPVFLAYDQTTQPTLWTSIAPALQGSAASPVVLAQLPAAPIPPPPPPPLSQIIGNAVAAAGITNPTLINLITNLLINDGITDPNAAQNLAAAVANLTNPNLITAILSNTTNADVAAAIAASGITDTSIASMLAYGGMVTDPSVAAALASAVSGLGYWSQWSILTTTTNVNVANALVSSGVAASDSWLTYLLSYDQVTSASQALALQAAIAPIGDSWLAAQLLYNTTDPSIITQIISTGITDPTLAGMAASIMQSGYANLQMAMWESSIMQNMGVSAGWWASQLAGAISNVTDPSIIASILWGTTNPSVAYAIANSGVTNPTVAYLLAADGIWDPSWAAALGGAVSNITDPTLLASILQYTTDPAAAYAAANSGTTDPTVLSVLAYADVTSVSAAQTIASEISGLSFWQGYAIASVGITNPAIAGAVAGAGITDPSIAYAVNQAGITSVSGALALEQQIYSAQAATVASTSTSTSTSSSGTTSSPTSATSVQSCSGTSCSSLTVL